MPATATVAPQPARVADVEIVELKGTRAIIVPPGVAFPLGENRYPYWSPSAADVRRAHARIREELQRASTAPDRFFAEPRTAEERAGRLGEIDKTLAAWDEETMQCVGVVIDGHCRLMCNFFPHRDDELGLQRWVLYYDGGFVYWQIQYDFDSDECLDFSSNGYA